VALELRTIRDFIRWGASRLNAEEAHFGHGTDNALDESAALVLHALHLGPELPSEFGDCRVTEAEAGRIRSLLVRRVTDRVPAAYLTGEAWFAGLCFQVDSRVLIPRSPVAELIESGFQPWLGDVAEPAILDMCTGSGCIAVATAVSLPTARVDAVDLSADALEVAQANVIRHAVEGQVRLLQSDLFGVLGDQRYDLIVSNPPYVGAGELAALPAEYAHEPGLALASGEDGLDIPLRILADSGRHLNENGVLIMEVGNSAVELAEQLPEAPFLWLEFERGGHGVLLLESAQLEALAPQVEALLKTRAHAHVE
jgi:ribosomal protein L3 glutamine methyltransferase